MIKHHNRQNGRGNKSAIFQRKADNNMKFIKNLPSLKLTNTEIIALGKGLKFIPTPTKPSRIKLL